MNIDTVAVINSVEFTFRDRGVTSFDATCDVLTVAAQMGYADPVRTGIWSRDLAGLLRVVSRRIRHPFPGESRFAS